MTTSEGVRPFLNPTELPVYLTLVAHADSSGLVTRCSLTDVADYAQLHNTNLAEQTLKTLEQRRLLVIQYIGPKTKHYLLIGGWKEYAQRAKTFMEEQRDRVTERQNGRARSRVKKQQGDFEVVALELVPSDGDNRAKYRFDVRVPGLGLIVGCMYKTPKLDIPGWVSPPMRLVKDEQNGGAEKKWRPVVQFDRDVNEKLVRILFQLTQAA